MKKKLFDCVIIGSGSGGYVAAIRAAQRGLVTALIEAREIGGTCLNRGCIPSKALIASANVFKKIQEANKFGIYVQDLYFDYAQMKHRKDSIVNGIQKSLEKLILSNKITIFNGYGRMISPYEVAITGKDEGILEAKNIILATGSEPRPLEKIPYDYKKIHDSTSLLNMTELPKKMAIIGGGVIGCEFASLYNTLGVDVTIVELLPHLLPNEGRNVQETLTASFKRQGIKIETTTIVKKISYQDDGIRLYLEDQRLLDADIVLVSIGRKYNTDAIGLDKAGVVVEEDGSIPTDEMMRTNIPHIFAIGDITGKWIFAHVASHQGLIAADNIAGQLNYMHYNAIPAVIFTNPEVATIGLTLEKAIQEGYDAILGKFPFQALGKSQVMIETEGFAQIVAEKNTGQILGAQVVGSGAGNLIAEIGLAIGSELTVDSITETIHAHPTTAEAWIEAAFLTKDMPLHLPPRIRR
ncbi:MAG: dihydrolipoyl dehydrogenase [Chlamydiales bacterium]